MASKKGSKEIVKLENKETGYYYTVTKNNKTATGKIKRRKYDPKLRKHVEMTEGKMSH
jgi:large subunit ribosomal protein L33